MSHSALLLIDIQNDFMPGGALAVADGDAILPRVNAAVADYDLVVASQDWHPENHQSFAKEHAGKAPYDVIELHGLEQVLWPVHCVRGSRGVDFHPDLNMQPVAAIFRKGMDATVDSYSAFYDNGHRHHTGLAAYLKSHAVTTLTVCGLAADFCVYFSILDALKEGFNVRLIESATRAIDANGWAKKKAELLKNPAFSIIE